MPYFLNKGGNFIKKFKSITLASLMGLALGLYCSKYINSMKSISSEDIKEKIQSISLDDLLEKIGEMDFQNLSSSLKKKIKNKLKDIEKKIN